MSYHVYVQHMLYTIREAFEVLFFENVYIDLIYY